MKRRKYSSTRGNCITELYQRSAFPLRSSSFYDAYSTYLTRESLQFNLYPQIVSPHSQKIASLDIDNSCESRFLLCGSSDCTVSVYDLSILGSEHHLQPEKVTLEDNDDKQNRNYLQQKTWKQKNRFRPIARSQKNFGTEDNHLDPLFVPDGHSFSVTNVLWYPVDTGVFLSSDSQGNILLWDTNSFIPVSSVKKTLVDDRNNVSSPCSIASMDLPQRNSAHMLLAIGCVRNGGKNYDHDNSMPKSLLQVDDRVVYLCDIRSGSMTHTLVGHGNGGVSCVQWNPMHDYILASGSRDNTIKLWDIRKSGSGACIATLDRENRIEQEVYFRSFRDNNEDEDGCNIQQTKIKRKKTSRKSYAPSDYSQVENCSFVQSHAGPVCNLKYTPDGNHIVSVSNADGMKLWDVQSGKGFGSVQPTRYLGPSMSNPRVIDRTQRNVPMTITQPYGRRSASVFIGGRNRNLLGYAVHGAGGKPDKCLAGHLDGVTAVVAQDNYGRLFTGGKEGMILGFGNKNEFEEDDAEEMGTSFWSI